MKRSIFIFISLVLCSSLLWRCSSEKSADYPKDLKSSLNYTAQKVNSALGQIAQTQGYKLLTIQESNALKSTTINNLFCYGYDSIELADISGIFEFHPVNYWHWCFDCYDKLFQKTGESNLLIAKMPKEKIFYPSRLYSMRPMDSTLKNNFIITATDYHYYFSRKGFYDYKLSADLVIDTAKIGNLDVLSSNSKSTGSIYSAEYAFPNGYAINIDTNSGDTAMISYSLSDSKGILLQETIKRIKSDWKYREKEYSLIIGNVEIVKTSLKDSIAIYVDGVLQSKAKVEFIDTGSDSTSVCKKRDVQITFDDGSVAKLSEMLGPSLVILGNLVDSMQSLYFSSKVVDYIAWSITHNKGYVKEGVRW